MDFRARLKRISSIRRNWLAHGRVGGEVAGVAFRRDAKDDYVTTLLSHTQVENLRPVSDVELEAMTQPVPVQVADADAVERRSYAVPQPPHGRMVPDVPPVVEELPVVVQAPEPPKMRLPAQPAQKPVPPSEWAKPQGQGRRNR